MGGDIEALQRGYRALRDPLREPDAFDRYFVFIDGSLLTFEDAPTSILLCGAPGMGKSTQLRALARALRASHRIIHIDVDQELDLQQVETVDLLFLVLAHAWARKFLKPGDEILLLRFMRKNLRPIIIFDDKMLLFMETIRFHKNIFLPLGAPDDSVYIF